MMPYDDNASFSNLRARGAFLVSASWINGTVVTPVSIKATSSRNVNCSFLTPWMGMTPKVIDVFSNVTIPIFEDTTAPIPNVWMFVGESGKEYALYSS